MANSFKLSLVNITRTGIAIPPIGLLSISSYLISEGILNSDDIQIADINIQDPLKEVLDFKPDIIGISAMTISYLEAQAFAKKLKKKLKDVPVIIGGVHISIASWSFSEAFDLGIIGEGEKTMAEVIEYFIKYKNLEITPALKDIKGLIYKNGAETIKTSPRELIGNLAELPELRWDFLSEQYFKTYPLIIFDRFVSAKIGHIITTRGCPYRCVFCSTSAFWQKLRLFPPEKIVDEIEWLFTNRGITVIDIWDDLFSITKQRVSQFTGLLREKGLLGKIKFSIQSRTNLIDEEMCALLKDLGVFSVGFGFESGSKKILDYLKNESTDPQKNKQAILLLEKYGISVSGSFMIGSPGETAEDMEKTLDFMSWMSTVKNVFRIWYGLTTPFPGTKLWDTAIEQGSVTESMDLSALDILHTRFSDNCPDLFFKGSISKKNFQNIWKRADEIVAHNDLKNRKNFPEAYAEFDKNNHELLIGLFKHLSVKQKISKVIQKPDKAFKVIINFIINKIYKPKK
jgi:anaerobic magnesium-protoporphyrin IX monomethyl ester cyclase